MSRTSITIDTIAAAVARLDAEGKKSTIAAIQAVVGGSMTTVSQLVREFRGEVEPTKIAEVADSEGVELPANVARALGAVPTAFLTAFGEVRAEERRSARAEIDAIRAEADSRSKAEAEKLEAAQAEIEALAEQSDKLEAALTAANEARKAAEIKASEAEKRAADKDRQITDLVSQISELAALVGKADPKPKAARQPRQKRIKATADAPQ